MKNDPVARRILAACLGVSAILLCSSLFMFSINSANASEQNSFNPENLMSVPAESAGKIMMDYTSVHVPSQDKTYYECMVWNTETGQSKLYFYSYTDKVFKAYEDNVQIPTYPLD